MHSRFLIVLDKGYRLDNKGSLTQFTKQKLRELKENKLLKEVVSKYIDNKLDHIYLRHLEKQYGAVCERDYPSAL